MIALVRYLFRLFIILGIIIVICFGALDFYFTHINHIDKKVEAAAKVLYKKKNVHPLSYGQIPLTFREAIIATEDRRFESDPGIDPIGIVRSVVVDIEHDGYIEGGSTITQQVIDNTVLTRKKTLQQKLIQATLAIGLYDTMSKEEVFILYANVIYFGNNGYGLYQAARTYFHRNPSDLNEGELTLLAGLPNSPSYFDPFLRMENARVRQKIVLENMVDAGTLTASEADKIYHEPIRLVK